MNRRLLLLTGLTGLLGLVGCMGQQIRSQSGEDDRDAREFEARTVGDVTSAAVIDPVPCSGVGLVVGLNGTGGPAPPGGYRALLEKELKQRKIDNVREMIDSPNNALVLVSALLPAGSRTGDPIDVQVELPPQSRATSLRGGYLGFVYLHEYNTRKRASPGFEGPDALMLGRRIAKAEGPVTVGLAPAADAQGAPKDEPADKAGRVWGGGRCDVEVPMLLALKDGQKFSRVAGEVIGRLNERFQGAQAGTSNEVIAAFRGTQVIALRLPAAYRHNMARFLLVARLVPLEGAPPAGGAYMKRLEELLHDPATTLSAALRLEAVGNEAVAVLKPALASEHALVRFAAAEALAYLGRPSSSACADELAKLAESHPSLRAFCLAALASYNEAASSVRLQALLASKEPDVAYGAFRALRLLDERDPAVRGEKLNGSFWLHQVAPTAEPRAHYLTGRRPEVVLFGRSPCLTGSFSFLVGPEFTVTAAKGESHCTVSRFSVKGGAQRKQCSFELAEVLRALAALGGTYPDAVELLRQAERHHGLGAELCIDALPKAVDVKQLAASAGGELGETPTLFEK
jgi:Flagellar P-ring protein